MIIKKEVLNELCGTTAGKSTPPLPPPNAPAEPWGLFEVREQFKVNSIVP